MGAIIEASGLTKAYGDNVAVDGVDLSVEDGAFFGILGPNGAGKTTLMRILAGLLEATAGSITLDGEDVLKHPERLWPHLGFLPQEFGFYPNLTGAAMLDFLLKMKGVQSPLGHVATEAIMMGHGRRRPREEEGMLERIPEPGHHCRIFLMG